MHCTRRHAIRAWLAASGAAVRRGRRRAGGVCQPRRAWRSTNRACRLAAVFAFGNGVALAALAPIDDACPVGQLALLALLLGLLLFSGSLAAERACCDGRRRWRPIGGMLLIGGWLRAGGGSSCVDEERRCPVTHADSIPMPRMRTCRAATANSATWMQEIGPIARRSALAQTVRSGRCAGARDPLPAAEWQGRGDDRRSRRSRHRQRPLPLRHAGAHATTRRSAPAAYRATRLLALRDLALRESAARSRRCGRWRRWTTTPSSPRWCRSAASAAGRWR